MKPTSKCISSIEGIAFKTSVPAADAAIAEARTDEQGKCFAIIAGEVLWPRA